MFLAETSILRVPGSLGQSRVLKQRQTDNAIQGSVARQIRLTEQGEAGVAFTSYPTNRTTVLAFQIAEIVDELEVVRGHRVLSSTLRRRKEA